MEGCLASGLAITGGIGHTTGAYIGLLLLATLIAVLADKLAGFPYTIALVLTGLGVGLAGVGPNPEELGFSHDLVFFVLLPPLLFQGGLHFDLSRLKQQFWPIASFAIFGVVVSTLAVGAIVWLSGGVSAFLVALLFGAILSPTDPVSVLALFRRAGVSPDLRAIVEGESLFNDGTGVVVFGILVAMIESHQSFSPGAALLRFVKVSAGGLVLGAGLGYVAWLFLRRVTDHLIETSACLILAMGAFWVAEALHLSGVIATVTAGLLIGNHGPQLSMTERTSQVVSDFFEVVDFLVNSVLFLLIGLEIRVIGVAGWTAYLPLVGASIGALLVARAVSVYPAWHLLNLGGTRRPGAWAHVLFWGGLRGSIPVALLLGLPRGGAIEPWRDALLVAGFAVVLFSLVVQGLTVQPLLRRLGLAGAGAGAGPGQEVTP